MSVDTIHPLLAGVFALVWLLVWQIILRSQRTSELDHEEQAELRRSKPRRPYVDEQTRTLRRTSQSRVH
jgi:hypothetical protein